MSHTQFYLRRFKSFCFVRQSKKKSIKHKQCAHSFKYYDLRQGKLKKNHRELAKSMYGNESMVCALF